MQSEYKYIKIRVFGNEKCHMCQRMKKDIHNISLTYEYIDAMADANQDFCDKHSVEKLPHIQAYDSETEKIIVEHRGYIGISDFINLIQKYISKNKISKVEIKNTECKSCGNSTSSVASSLPQPNIDFLN